MQSDSNENHNTYILYTRCQTLKTVTSQCCDCHCTPSAFSSKFAKTWTLHILVYCIFLFITKQTFDYFEQYTFDETMI